MDKYQAANITAPLGYVRTEKMNKEPICTTLNKIRDHHPCADGWSKLLKFLNKTQPDDEPLPLSTILKSNGLADTLWCLCTLPEHEREWRLLAVAYARRVEHLMTDERSITAIDVAERYANGDATSEEMDAAWAAAWAAARAAEWDAALDAEWDVERERQAQKFLEVVGE